MKDFVTEEDAGLVRKDLGDVCHMHFFRLGSRQKNDEASRSFIGAPWDIYAVSEVMTGTGLPPYFSVEGVDEGFVLLRELEPGSDEYRRVQKWAGVVKKDGPYRTAERRVLTNIDAGCRIENPLLLLPTLILENVKCGYWE